MIVSIGIITKSRPQGLARLLESLQELNTSNYKSRLELKIIVVDNDANGSAESVVNSYAHLIDCYDIEPTPGIPFARNRVLKNAFAFKSDFIAFVDDDEIVSRNWLLELLTTRETTAADVVTGPVLPQFDGTPPTWIRKGQFFERRKHVQGEQINYARTGNVLISMKSVAVLSRWFEERMATTGGSDTEFFIRLRKNGAKLVWAESAVVYESVPESRATASWLVLRAFRLGNTLALCDRIIEPGARTFMLRLFKGIGRILQGLLQLIPALFLGKAPVLRAVTTVARGCGMVLGLFGVKYREYIRVHGN